MTNKSVREIKLYFRACLIALLITLNTYLISNKLFVLALFVGGCISFVWTLNVKAIAVSNWKDRVVYTMGGVTGTFISLFWLSKIFK